MVLPRSDPKLVGTGLAGEEGADCPSPRTPPLLQPFGSLAAGLVNPFPIM